MMPWDKYNLLHSTKEVVNLSGWLLGLLQCGNSCEIHIKEMQEPRRRQNRRLVLFVFG